MIASHQRTCRGIVSPSGWLILLGLIHLGGATAAAWGDPILTAAIPELGLGVDELAFSDTASDELLLFADMQIVVSASRQAQPLNLASVPISVITADDIHYGGLTNIPEALQFVPGMDVLRMDRNHYAIGVRGLHDMFANRTLTLIDGRNAGDILSGVAQFERLPIFMEDIARIEVVRGPGGASWGANALNGVVNVIMKQPKDTLGVMATSTFNEFGDTYSQVRWGHAIDKWSWRLSVGYEDFESSEDAIAGDDFESNDFGRNYRFDGLAVYEPSRESKVSFGVAGSHYTHGQLGLSGLLSDAAPYDQALSETVRLFARIDHEFENGATGYLQWFGNFASVDDPGLIVLDTYENDVEAQLSFEPADHHEMTVGGNVRLTHVDSKSSDPSNVNLPGGSYNDEWLGLFVIDRWHVTESLVLEGQLRGDYYSGTGFDWSGRLGAVYALDDAGHHVVRVAGARSYRSAGNDLRHMLIQAGQLPSPPFAPGSFGYTLNGDDDIDNEGVWAAEAGYTGRLNEALTLRLDGYFQRYSNLIGTRITNDFPLTLVWDDAGEANAYGAEVELTWKAPGPRAAQVSVWYAYNGIDVDLHKGQGNVRSYLPAPHKAGVTARFPLPDDWTIHTAYRYTDTSPSSDPAFDDVRPTHRLDLTLSKVLLSENAEFTVGVLDVLDMGHAPATGFTGPGDDVPGRTLFGRVQFNF